MQHDSENTLIYALIISALLSQQQQAYDQNAYSMLTDRATAYDADPTLVIRVAMCENHYLDAYGAIGSLGERGIGQWLPGPNAWRSTPAYIYEHVDIDVLYATGDPSAMWWDVSMLAWAFSPHAPPKLRNQWSCFSNAN